MTKELEALEKLRQNNKDNSHLFDDELLGIIETALKEYELMKQTKIIVADKKISDEGLEKLKNQRMFVGNLEQCEIKPLFDEENQKKLKALEIIKEHKLLNYVLKNEKCANMYHLSKEEKDLLRDIMERKEVVV